MDKAKAAVGNFLSKDGKHDTTVHETAIDREVHQHHHHTSIQPIHHKEVQSEIHHHNQGAVEHRNISHGDDSHIRERLAAEKAQFKNTQTTGDTKHTRADSGVVVGEHIHHHVHENIQPVIQKETIQPHVVHTTNHVHEIHQNEAKHHTATQLPAVSMEDFKRQGGHLGGREERSDAFVGEPRAVGGALGGLGAHGTTSVTKEERAIGNGHNGVGHNGNIHSGVAHNGTVHNGDKHSGTTTGLSGTTGHNTHNTANGADLHKKASLLDKINPKKDANGDGKAGFMS